MKISPICWGVIVALMFGGCSIFPSGVKNEKTYYVIPAIACLKKIQPNPAGSLFLQDTEANQFINSLKINFSRTPETRGNYQFAAWVEPPPQRFSFLLREQLDCAGLYQSVLHGSTGSSSDWILASEITDLYHDISTNPGTVIFNLRVELLEAKNSKLVASKTFNLTQPAVSFDSTGAVKGMIAVMQLGRDQIIEWLGQIS